MTTFETPAEPLTPTLDLADVIAPDEVLPAPRSRHKGIALTVICVAQLMVILDATVVNVALPPIKHDLGFSSTGLEWVITAYSLTFGGLLLFGGRTGDLFGRRRMFIVGVALFSLSSLAGGLAQDPAMLVIARAIQGIGGAIAAPTALALIVTTFAEGAERTRALGVYAAMAAIGGALGLLIGGTLTDVASWRWSLFINVPIGIVVLALAPLVLTESSGNGDKLDVPGAVLSTLGMTSLVYGVTNAGDHGITALWSWLPLAAAAALLTAFVQVERRAAAPLLPLRILEDRNRIAAYVIMFCTGAFIFTVFFYSVQYLQILHGFSPVLTGVGFLPMPLTIMVISMVLMPWLLPRFGARKLLTIAGIGMTVAGAIYATTTAGGGYLAELPGFVCQAVGMGCAFVPLTTLAVSGVEGRDTGVASALLNTGQQLGGAVGLSLLGTLGARAAAHRAQQLASQHHGVLSTSLQHDVFVYGQQHAFYGAIVMALVVLAFAIALVRPRVSSPRGA